MTDITFRWKTNCTGCLGAHRLSAKPQRHALRLCDWSPRTYVSGDTPALFECRIGRCVEPGEAE